MQMGHRSSSPDPQLWLFIVTHIGPGGTREVLELLRSEFAISGLNVRVVALYRGPGKEGPAFPCEVLVDRRVLGTLDYVRVLRRLLAVMRTVRPTTVLTFMPAANVVGGTLAWLFGAGLRIATHHQPAWTQNGWLARVDWLLGTFGVYSRIVAVSQSIKSSFDSYPLRYRRRLHTIPNAVRGVAAQQSRAHVRRALQIRDDAVLAVIVGRLSTEKNLLNTVAAIAQVPELSVVLVGEGPLREELERWIRHRCVADRVVLVGQQPRQRVFDIMFAADLFLQLSDFEGRSLALLEAVSAGKAIVVSDIPAQREVLTCPDGALAGLLCDPKDVQSIAVALRAVTADARLRRELADRTARLSGALDVGAMVRGYKSLSKPG